MASVYLTTTNNAASAGDWWTNFSRLRQSALGCRTRPMLRIVENHEDAEIILFSYSLSSTQADVRNHVLTRKFEKKVFIYSTTRDVPVLPGVYTYAETSWYLPSHMRAGFYVNVFDHDWI